MNYFWITFQIVAGIVSPLLLLWILCLACYVIILAIESAVYALQKLSKKLSKQAPFDDIAINDGKETIRKVKGFRSIMKGLRKIFRDEIQH